MKAQLIPIVFLLIAASLLVFGFIFYNIFYGYKYQVQVFEITTIDVVRNLIENFKSFLKLSLTYSTLQSISEHGLAGGSIGAGAWICNGPNPLPASLSKKCLEEYTKYYLNIYLEKYNTTLPVDLKASPFLELNYDIDIDKILRGKYDEGNYWVNASGAFLIASSKDKNINLFEIFNTSDYITKNRYWYLFRIFTEWANEDVLTKCICINLGCACQTKSGETSCTNCLEESQYCGELALKSLQEKFDENVKCTFSIGCCMEGTADSGCEVSDCISWSSRCTFNCTHDCTKPPITTSTGIEKSLLNVPEQSYLPSTSSSFLSSSLQCFSEYWYEARFSSIYTFTCKDYKYYTSSPKGPKPLEFTVVAFASLRDKDICREKIPCDCPTDAVSCSDCRQTGCTPCS